MELLIVATGGAIGAILRYWAALLLVSRLKVWVLPAATLLVNLAGSLALGLLLGHLFATVPRGADVLDDRWALFLGVGICGSFTTFSTFATELAQLFEVRNPGAMLAYVVLTLGGCVALFLLGFWLTG